jgi:hypothetical protein
MSENGRKIVPTDGVRPAYKKDSDPGFVRLWAVYGPYRLDNRQWRSQRARF